MKNKLAAPLLALCLLVPFFVAPALAADANVATVSIQKVLDNSDVAQDARQEIEAEFEKHRESLQKEQAELEALQAEIEKKSTVWSDKTRERKEGELENRIQEFEARNEDAQSAVQEMEQELMEPVLQAMNEIIEEIGRQGDYEFILDYTEKGLRTRTGLFYADDDLDISLEVQEKLDQRLEE